MQDEKKPAERKTLDERNRMTELQRIRHSCAHIMATAVTRLWPDALLEKLALRRLRVADLLSLS